MATELTVKDCVLALLTNEKELIKKAINALIQIVDKVLCDFDDPNNRILYLSSDVMMGVLLPALGAMELLFCVGFREEEDRLEICDMSRLDLLVYCRNALRQHEIQEPLRVNRECIPNTSTEKNLRLELDKHFQQMEYFEIPELQRMAKELIPLNDLNKEALEKYNLLRSQDPAVNLQDCLLMGLMAWFKEDFFSWYDSGFCEKCHQKMKFVSTVDCNREERENVGIRTELHGCPKCSREERFPRYFYPGALLRTRKGRCMEWASCFMLMCRSLHFDTRYILDKTDHVWNEIYFESQDRWVHVDPCENKVDTPLMYEKGWNKSLAYVYAFSQHEIIDCVWKYTAQHEATCLRRSQYKERFLSATIQSLNDIKQKDLSSDRKTFIQKRTLKEIVSFFNPPSTEGEFEGRSSGSLVWRLARGETSSSVEGKFSFIPTPDEVEALELVVKYSIIRDSYLRNGDMTNKWRECVFSAKNIFRKHEKDWKNIYLARKEGSEEGEISWRFDWSSSGLKLKSVLVHFAHTTFENGSVHWKLCAKDVCIPGNSTGKLELTAADLPHDVRELDLKCELLGGKGDVSWQHAQLFRQNESDQHSFPFIVHLRFQ